MCNQTPTVFIASLKHGYLTLFLTIKSFLVNTRFIVKSEDLVEVEFSLLLVTHLLKDIIILEKLQRCATKYILNDFTSDYRSHLIALKINIFYP